MSKGRGLMLAIRQLSIVELHVREEVRGLPFLAHGGNQLLMEHVLDGVVDALTQLLRHVAYQTAIRRPTPLDARLDRDEEDIHIQKYLACHSGLDSK